jgi:peroxiredoxin
VRKILHGGITMAKIGQSIDNFTVNALSRRSSFKEVSLDQYKGKVDHSCSFYPADFTFVCPTELGEMADLYPEFQAEGAEILSVSTDTEFTHFAWHNSSETIKKIQYPMLADPTAKLARYFGVYIEEEGLALTGHLHHRPRRGPQSNGNQRQRHRPKRSTKPFGSSRPPNMSGKTAKSALPAGSRVRKRLVPGIELVGKI